MHVAAALGTKRESRPTKTARIRLQATRGPEARSRMHEGGPRFTATGLGVVWHAVNEEALDSATARRAVTTSDTVEAVGSPPTLDGLSEPTRDQLRRLATTALQGLGVPDPSPDFVRDEMVRQCAQLGGTLPAASSAAERERLLQVAIERAIERLDDDQRY